MDWEGLSIYDAVHRDTPVYHNPHYPVRRRQLVLAYGISPGVNPPGGDPRLPQQFNMARSIYEDEDMEPIDGLEQIFSAYGMNNILQKWPGPKPQMAPATIGKVVTATPRQIVRQQAPVQMIQGRITHRQAQPTPYQGGRSPFSTQGQRWRMR